MLTGPKNPIEVFDVALCKACPRPMFENRDNKNGSCNPIYALSAKISWNMISSLGFLGNSS